MHLMEENELPGKPSGRFLEGCRKTAARNLSERPGRDCSSPKGQSYDEPLLACPLWPGLRVSSSSSSPPKSPVPPGIFADRRLRTNLEAPATEGKPTKARHMIRPEGCYSHGRAAYKSWLRPSPPVPGPAEARVRCQSQPRVRGPIPGHHQLGANHWMLNFHLLAKLECRVFGRFGL